MDNDTIEFDLGFLDDNSKEIKALLTIFCPRYERLSAEQKAATKEWLEAVVELERHPPAPSFEPRIYLEMMFPEGEWDYFHWRFPADILVKAVMHMDSTGKYFVEWEDCLHWYDPPSTARDPTDS
jgi:hypothetical protein